MRAFGQRSYHSAYMDSNDFYFIAVRRRIDQIGADYANRRSVRQRKMKYHLVWLDIIAREFRVAGFCKVISGNNELLALPLDDNEAFYSILCKGNAGTRNSEECTNKTGKPSPRRQQPFRLPYTTASCAILPFFAFSYNWLVRVKIEASGCIAPGNILNWK